MDVEKPASKGHGFFGLFDWGKKSKKRIFVGSTSSSPDPKNAGDGKDVDDSTPSTQSNSILEDAPSLKESSEHSCSSSVIDEETQARRCPTVVARLMGLDSMPAASSSESNPMPSIAQQPFQANNHDDSTGRSYVGSPHKMPGSPIDRFKMEALPPRLAKRTLSVAQYKLLSPMKNPNNISSRNAADIMEAASRIIRPGVENISSYRVHDVGHANAARAYNPGEIIGVQQRSQKLNKALGKRDGPASFRPPNEKYLDGRSRSSEGASSSRISQSNGCAPVGPKVKPSNRSSNVAQAIRAQGKEGTRKGGRRLETRRNPENSLVERYGFNQQKDNNQMVATSSSSMLVPNNRKQNAVVTKHKVNSNPANPGRQRSNIHPVNASPRKVGAAGTFAGISTQASRKVDLQPTAHANVRNNSIAKAIPKPRRLQNRRLYSDTSQSSDSINSDRSQRRIRHNIVIDEQSSFSTNKKKISTEIVSFTFTSPVDKSLHGTHFPNHSVEKQFIENLNAVSTSSNTSNTKLDVIDGDYLGLLLEQKLRELTSGVRSPYSKAAKGVKVYGTSTALEDTASACETSSIASTDYDRESLQSFNAGKATVPQTDLATKSGQPFQPAKDDHDATDRAEFEHLHLSPLSMWEASISTETCSSSESWRSANGTRLFSSTEGATTSGSTHFNKFLEADASSEYSDTASSITVATAEIPRSESSSSCHMDHRQEVEFIREILKASSSCLERFGDSDILDPHLLEELNGSTRLLAGNEGKGYRLRRRLLFDCVNELLTVKCAYYFNAGYSSWLMGMAVLQNLSAEEIHREMTSLKVAEEWMVDELVYREMSTPLGSWVDFKMDSYQAGGDIVLELLGSLIDEVVADLLTGSFL
ncbi:hypothetical protein GQ55_9G019800 [Panicum hallii var. hallii]|uniref:DUF4378 domain-containing protein n=1 Tax=Panicum hallii var. hallii TaxID=1504633 RepID=A0A2T7BYQ7_9POAL|nr:hypothetical protein GQ55_9G019800 [Panicum hallii var. hallii]